MSIRDEEIKRLTQYAKGLNLKISFSKYIPYSGDVGSWSIDGTELTIFVKKTDSKISIILTIIHELGHQLEFIHNHNRKISETLASAFDDETNKINRKIILDYEKASSHWWDIIYKETNMSFPFYKLEIAKEFDIWVYEEYYQTGKFPNRKDKIQKYKELRRKYEND